VQSRTGLRGLEQDIGALKSKKSSETATQITVSEHVSAIHSMILDDGRTSTRKTGGAEHGSRLCYEYTELSHISVLSLAAVPSLSC
jgi:hypothetical protein